LGPTAFLPEDVILSAVKVHDGCEVLQPYVYRDMPVTLAPNEVAVIEGLAVHMEAVSDSLRAWFREAGPSESRWRWAGRRGRRR
jgi:hypothetical protein